MINNFILIASLVIEHGGDVSFEWPAFCEGGPLIDCSCFSVNTALKLQDVMGVPLD